MTSGERFGRHVTIGMVTAAYLSALAVAVIFLHLPPLVPLLVTLGAAALAGLIFNPLFGVHVFLLLLFVENLLTSSSGLTGMKVVGPVILTGWLIRMAVQKKSPFRLEGYGVLIIVFLAWCSLSLLYSPNTERALISLTTFMQLALAVQMFLSMVDTPARVRGVMLAIVLWTTLSTLVGIVLYYLGRAPMVAGLGENRNYFALYINIAVICAHLLGPTMRSRPGRVGLMVVLPVLYLGLALTFSRAGFLVLGFSLVMVWYRATRERRIGILLSSVIVLAGLLLFLPQQVWERAGSIRTSIESREGSFGTRVNLWHVGLEMVADHPLTGVGLGSFINAFPRYARGQMMGTRLVAHNSYVHVAAETGLPGLVLFLLLHILALRSTHRALRAGLQPGVVELWPLAIAVEGSILAIMATGLSNNTEGWKLLWIFFGLALSLGRLAARHELVTTAPAPDARSAEATPEGAGA